LTRELAERLLHVGADVPGLLVLAPVVGRDLGELFAAARINVMDLAGKEDVPLVEDFPLVPEEETPKFDHPAMTLQLRMVRAIIHPSAFDELKNAYNLEFLALRDVHSEVDLHGALLRHLGRFLTEPAPQSAPPPS
jgi:hypothetical protein